MRRYVEFFIAAILGISPAFAGAQDFRGRMTAPAVAAAGALDCRGLPQDGEAVAQHLVGLGWSRRATPGAANRPPQTYFERDNILLLVTPPRERSPLGSGCLAMFAFDEASRWTDLIAAATAAFGQPPESDRNNIAIWTLARTHQAMLTRTAAGRATFHIFPIRNRR